MDERKHSPMYRTRGIRFGTIRHKISLLEVGESHVQVVADRKEYVRHVKNVDNCRLTDSMKQMRFACTFNECFNLINARDTFFVLRVLRLPDET